MNMAAFDGMARKAGQGFTRRRVIRLLGTAAAGVVAGVGLSGPAPAKRKRGKKRPKPKQVACTSWILSGGPDPTTRIEVDDDLVVAINGITFLDDANSKGSSLSPLAFMANVGDELGILAYDAVPSCRSLSPLWLHCATTGQKRQLFAGNSDGCASGRTAGFFVKEFFTISL